MRKITAREILEAYETTFRGTMGHSVPLFVNPTREELEDLGDAVRFIADAKEKQIHIWNADVALHGEASRTLGITDYKPWQIPGIAVKRGSRFVAANYVDGMEHDQDYIMGCLECDWSWVKHFGIDLDPIVVEYLPGRLKRWGE
jgi:hypothetical protein